MSKFKTITLKGDNTQNINTELYFELASARAEKCEVVAISTECSTEKVESLVVSALKKMKTASSIQFYATPESFKLPSTEAVFLLNKYPDVFIGDCCYQYIYVKL